MKILFVWTGVTSYMADCWRRLQQEPGVELKVVVECVEIGKEFDKGKVLQSLDACFVEGGGPRSSSLTSGKDSASPLAIASASAWLGEWTPDVVFAVGWHSEVVRAFVTRKDWRDVPKVCCFDLPWRWKLRCIAARFVLRRFLRHYAAAYVPGVACERYARWLGFTDVWRGLFSIRAERFAGPETPRKGFLFVGRKAPEKGVDVLRAAYGHYRTCGGTWPLDIPEWIDPEDVPRAMREHACLVLPSRWEPWGVVVAEAKAAGMKVIVSDKVNARHDLPCEGVFSSGDAAGLAEAMLQVEREGTSAPVDVAFWDCVRWVARVREICAKVAGKGGGNV